MLQNLQNIVVDLDAVADILPDELEVVPSIEVSYVVERSRDEIIDAGYAVSLIEEVVAHVTADEPGATSHDHMTLSHGTSRIHLEFPRNAGL